jgi:hypothetical protein
VPRPKPLVHFTDLTYQLTIAELLGGIEEPRTPASAQSPGSIANDPILQAAKADVIRVLEILEHVGSSAPNMQKTRTEVLRRALESIRW